MFICSINSMCFDQKAWEVRCVCVCVCVSQLVQKLKSRPEGPAANRSGLQKGENYSFCLVVSVAIHVHHTPLGRVKNCVVFLLVASPLTSVWHWLCSHASHLDITKRRGGESCSQEARTDILMPSLKAKTKGHQTGCVCVCVCVCYVCVYMYQHRHVYMFCVYACVECLCASVPHKCAVYIWRYMCICVQHMLRWHVSHCGWIMLWVLVCPGVWWRKWVW